MKFVKREATVPGLKHINWGMYYIGTTPVRVILGPCISIICSSEQARIIGISHIYPCPFDDDRYGPYNHPENVVSAYLQQLRRLRVQDTAFWIIDREKTTTRGKELIMRSIDTVVKANFSPTLLSGFPKRCVLTSNPQQMQIEVYDIASHEDLIV